MMSWVVQRLSFAHGQKSTRFSFVQKIEGWLCVFLFGFLCLLLELVLICLLFEYVLGLRVYWEETRMASFSTFSLTQREKEESGEWKDGKSWWKIGDDQEGDIYGKTISYLTSLVLYILFYMQWLHEIQQNRRAEPEKNQREESGKSKYIVL